MTNNKVKENISNWITPQAQELWEMIKVKIAEARQDEREKIFGDECKVGFRIDILKADGTIHSWKRIK